MFRGTAELGREPDGPDEVALLQHGDPVPGPPLDDVDWRDLLVAPRGWRLDRRLSWAARDS